MNLLFIYSFGAGVFLILEALSFWRVQERYSRRVRWNVGMAFLGLLAIRILGMAGMIRSGSGALWDKIPVLLQFVFGFLLLDFIQYYVHRAFHFFPSLWRFHRIHHMDQGLDWSTGMRFHFLELVLSFWVRAIFAYRLGVPTQVFFAYEGALIFAELYTHSNWKLRPSIEHFLQRVLITPSLHRVHHSQNEYERLSNFGSVFSFWDRRFESLRLHCDGELQLGVRALKDEDYKWISLLWLPFQKGPSEK